MIRLFLTVAFFALCAAEPAAADPVSAIAAWVGATLKIGAATALALTQVGIGLALNAVSMALAKTMGRQQRTKVEFEVQMGDDLPLSFPLGTYAAAGQRKYIGSWGGSRHFITEVVEYSALPQGLARFWVDDDIGSYIGDLIGTVAADGDRKRIGYVDPASTLAPGRLSLGRCVSNYNDTGNARIWIKVVSGTQVAADPFLLWAFGNRDDWEWTEDHIGTGKSYAIITTRYDSDTLTQYPTYLLEPAPLPLYDPRKDSTVGGSGAHRWGNRATYEPSTNALVMAYNVSRGIYLGDEWIFGGRNLAAWRLPLAEWAMAMNACDAAVARAGGGTEAAYRAGMLVSVDMSAADVLEELGAAANTRFAEVGGRLKPLTNLPVAAVLGITDADIVITEGQGFTPFAPISETFNALTATYPEPDEKWATKDAPEFVSTGALAEDGGRYLPTAISYPAVPFGAQVQRLMRSQLLDYRRMRRHQLVLPPDAYGLEPLDMISWTSERNGYEAKMFLVESVAKLPGLSVSVSLREVDPGDYDWSSEFERSVTVILPAPIAPLVQAVQGLVVAPETIDDGAGTPKRPAIRVTVNSDEVGITSIRIQLRRSSGAVEQDFTRPFDEGDLGSTANWLVQNVLANTVYEVRVQLTSALAQQSLWSDWEAVTTDVVSPLGSDDLAAIAAPAVPAGLTVTSSILTSAAGGQTARMAITWSAAARAASYELEVTPGGGEASILPAGGLRLDLSAQPGTAWMFRVRARNLVGTPSGWSAALAHTAAVDTTPPAAPTDLALTPGFKHFWLRWAANAEPDLHHYEIYEASAATPEPVTATAATFSTTTNQLVRSGLGDEATRHYWVRAIDTSGNKSGWSARIEGTTTAPPAIDPDDLAAVLNDVANAEIIPANAFAAKSIAAKHLALTDFENLIPDGSFAQRDLALVSKSGTSTVVFEDDSAASNGSVLRWTNPVAGVANSPDARQSPNHFSPAVPGETYWMETRAKAGAAGKGANMRLRAIFYTAAGAVISGPTAVGPFALGTSFEVKAGKLVAPAGSAWMQWSFYRENNTAEIDVLIDYVTIRRANAAKLVVDGSLTAAMVGTNLLVTSAANIDLAVINSGHIADLDAGVITSGKFTSDFLRVNRLLAFAETGALSAFKDGADDDTDGVFFGQVPDGSGGLRFAFSASRTGSGGKKQEISLTNSGFLLSNPSFEVVGATPPTSFVRTASLASTSLNAGSNIAKRLRVTQGLGGGGGGSSGDAGPGSAGAATVIRVYDGATLKRTITCAGGAGGTGDTGHLDRQAGENSIAGTGGAAPEVNGNGKAATGYGAGGGGGGIPAGKPGVGGKAAVNTTADWIDVSSYADPRIAITIGGGGAGGAAYSNRKVGGNGSPGRAIYEVSYAATVPADVVPLVPSATGTFPKTTAAGSFPDLGPGLWFISAVGAATLAIVELTISPGVVLDIWQDRSATFFASQRPTWGAEPSARTIQYAFYSMGSRS